jgi:hypothetical protein
MNTAATEDPWASTDHDPLSHIEQIRTAVTTVTVRAISGAVLAQYPDFPPGTPVRVLPAIVSNALPTDCRVVDDNWTFVGPTRHLDYADIRHDHDHDHVAVDRRRLQLRPAN